MNALEEQRPNPDDLLTILKKEEEKTGKAHLKIFFGMSAGVGKTYDMLKSAHEALSKGVDVAIGYVETHKRKETEALTLGLEVIPRKKVEYRGTALEEMDLDAIIARKPKLVLVDELAHTNAPGSRHTKRYQDVEELLDNGIDVYTTLNVQHLESRADTVVQITGSTVRETVPDSIFEHADEVELIDIPPDELLKRFSEGKVYMLERTQQAFQNFFKKGNLTALREMALRLTAERVDHQLRDIMQTQRISGPWKSGQRFLVGINESAESISLIRWARRMSYSMNASWVVVFVETARPLSEPAKNQLAKNIKLARELGAEVLSTSDEDVAAALVRVAHQQNVTQILIGKPQQRIFFRKSILDRVIEKSGDLDVYAFGGGEESEGKPRHFHIPEIQSGITQYVVSAATITLVATLCYPLSSFLGYQTVSLILLLTVALLPLKLGVGPVLAAAALSALAWDYFYIPPKYTLVIGYSQDILMLLTYFVIATVSGVLTARIRAREKAVRQREERATALYSLTKDMTSAATQDDVATLAVANIKKFFNTEVAIFLAEPDGDIFTKAHPASTFETDPKEFSVAAWVYWNEKKAGKNTETLPFANATYYPISGPRYSMGVVGVKPVEGKPFTLDQEILLQNFISQVSSTVEREFLNEIAKKSIVVAESERLYKTLFNSISHELRTPIAAILGAVEHLQSENLSQGSGAKDELFSEIRTASGRLNRLVENFLDMTRLESGLIKPKRDWCDLHDLINSVVNDLREELSRNNVTVHIPGDVPLLKIDFGLIKQAISNVLQNASVYTPVGSEINIAVAVVDQICEISIADNGPGLPQNFLEKVFEKFYRVPGTKAGGTGLGLSIAKGFVEAHQGTLTAENKPEGGAKFIIRLAIEQPASVDSTK